MDTLRRSLPTALSSLLFGLGLAWAETANAPTILVPFALPAGIGSTAVAVGDVDLDGRRDIVVANRDSDDLTILYGRGDGRFEDPVSLATLADPADVQVATMTEDSLPDIVVAHRSPRKVATLVQGPPRAFILGAAARTDEGPTGLAIADFDGDGIRDAATANSHSDGTVSYLRGLGDGTFAEAVDYPTGDGESSARSIALAAVEVDGDRAADLLVANFDTDQVAFLRGEGDGTFAAPVTYDVGVSPVGITVGDLNGDGETDVVTADEATFTVSVLLGRGDGTFEPSIQVDGGVFPSAVAIADLNLDGIADIAVSESSGAMGGMSVLRGTGDGTFRPREPFQATGSSPADLAIGDVNGDSWPDVVTANLHAPSEDLSVTLFLNQSGITPSPTPTATPTSTETPTPTETETETATPSPTLTPTPICAGDCNADGTVTQDELRAAIAAALSTPPVLACEAVDRNRDGEITVEELVTAVVLASEGCG